MEESITYEFEKVKTIKGFPELHWTGKRPYKSTQYFPAQLKEQYGSEKDGWINKIFWGDNLQVMSHMLKDYRGKINLIYIDPPFDSKADYKKKIKLRGTEVYNDNNSFEEKQYGDIWTNDEYLQFMYERLILLRELLSPRGSIFVHCDWHKSHYIRILMDEVFGKENFINEIVWKYTGGTDPTNSFAKKHDNIYFYRGMAPTFNMLYEDFAESTIKRFNKIDENGKRYKENTLYDGRVTRTYMKEEGKVMSDVWIDDILDINIVVKSHNESENYPTQKPEALLEKIIKCATNPGDIVFDCFMGSGTTQAVAMKLGRKFIGADINLGAIQTTTKRLLNVAKELENDEDKYTGFEVYNVNNYDFFRNPVEAKDLLIDALQIQKFENGMIYDGELDGRMVKIMPVNRIATRADLESLRAELPYCKFDIRREENPLEPVEKITLVCMGHEPSLKAEFEHDLLPYKVDIEVLDILKDKTELQLKRDSDAVIAKENGFIEIKEFYPMNLLQKLSWQREEVKDWKELVESIMIDWNYDGAVMQPTICDVPKKNNLVRGNYEIPSDAGKIRIKITDLLSESLEVEV